MRDQNTQHHLRFQIHIYKQNYLSSKLNYTIREADLKVGLATDPRLRFGPTNKLRLRTR